MSTSQKPGQRVVPVVERMHRHFAADRRMKAGTPAMTFPRAGSTTSPGSPSARSWPRLRYADIRQYRRWWRSECVIASAIGDRWYGQLQPLWYGDWHYRRGLLASRQRVQDYVSAGDAGRERLRAGSFHGLQSVGQDGGQHLHHLPVAIVAARQLGADLLEGSRQRPIFERRAVPERARLARQHRHVVPGIIRNLVASKPPCVLANDDAVLLDHNAIGIGVHVDRPANGLRGHRVLVEVCFCTSSTSCSEGPCSISWSTHTVRSRRSGSTQAPPRLSITRCSSGCLSRCTSSPRASASSALWLGAGAHSYDSAFQEIPALNHKTPLARKTTSAAR